MVTEKQYVLTIARTVIYELWLEAGSIEEARAESIKDWPIALENDIGVTATTAVAKITRADSVRGLTEECSITFPVAGDAEGKTQWETNE